MSSMAYAGRMPYAAEASAIERVNFIRNTYLHLALAVLAFIGLEVVLIPSSLAPAMTTFLMGGNLNMLIFFGAFMVVSWLANSWAVSATSKTTQYFGLGLYVLIEAIWFLPLLYLLTTRVAGGSAMITTAGIVTFGIFAGLTAFVMITGMDFSFLRMALMLGGFAAMGLILASFLFGFSLGMAFTVFMIVLASGYILYYTSNVMQHYHTDQYVAASLALFAAVALLFWYVLRLVMSLNRN